MRPKLLSVGFCLAVQSAFQPMQSVLYRSVAAPGEVSPSQEAAVSMLSRQMLPPGWNEVDAWALLPLIKMVAATSMAKRNSWSGGRIIVPPLTRALNLSGDGGEEGRRRRQSPGWRSQRTL